MTPTSVNQQACACRRATAARCRGAAGAGAQRRQRRVRSSMPASTRRAASLPACSSARSAWAASATCGCAAPPREAGRRGSRCAVRSRCWPAWPASTPAGAWRRARRRPAARSSSPSAPARRARSPARRRCSPNSATATAPRTACIVLEVDRPPPRVVDRQAACATAALAPEALTIVLTPTTSLAGTTQVVARVLEVALHKAHELHFALHDIVDGTASAPLPAPSPDGVQAMGRTNDAILYGGRVHLSVRGSDDAAQALAEQLPSRNSRDFGRSFADIFKAAELRLLQDRSRRCSPRPRSGSATSPAAAPGMPAGWTWRCCKAGGSVDRGPSAGPLPSRPAEDRLRSTADEGLHDCSSGGDDDEAGWHTRQLQAALRERGAVGRCIDLAPPAASTPRWPGTAWRCPASAANCPTPCWCAASPAAASSR